MSPEELKRVKAIFAEAVEKSGAERRAFLDQVCGDDQGLRAEVQAFLSASGRAGDAMGSPDETLPGDTAVPANRSAASHDGSILPTRVQYFGDYELLDEIARGGMGVVYKARQASLNRTVALKMILAGRLASRAEQQRFRAEAEAAASLDNPNIVPLYEVGEYDGRQYFTMKLMDGGSLAQRMVRDGKEYTQNPPLAARLISIIAGAVHYGHQRGILHRDLKPANVLLDRDGTPYVTDFGLAKRIDVGPVDGNPTEAALEAQLTASGTVVGTPAYMAPEQARGHSRQVTVATDVYGAGTILYHLLTGRPPFEDASLTELLRAVAEKEPVRPQSVNPKIDRDLETICLKALAKEPAGRYASALALKEDLDRWLAGEPILARRTGLAEQAVKWARRNPAIASLLATIAVSLLCGMVLVTWQWRRAEKQRQFAESARQFAVTQRGVAETQRLRADEQSRRNQRIAAGLALERGINYCEHEEVPRGLLWLARGLEMAGRENPDLQWDARMNIGAWLPRLHSLQHILPQNDAGGSEDPGGSRLAYSPDGAYLLVVGRTTVQAWDTTTGSRIGAPFAPGGGRSATAISPDARRVFIPHDGRLITWDVATQRATADRPLDNLENVQAMIVSPDGARLVASCKQEQKGVIRMWDLNSAKRVGPELPTDEPATVLAMNGDGSRLIAGCPKNTLLWDLSSGGPAGKVIPHVNIACAAFRPDGLAFATGGWDHWVHVWNTATLAPGIAFSHTAAVRGVAYSPDGTRLASASHDYTAQLWDADTGQRIGTPVLHSGWTFAVAFDPSGKSLASGDSRLVRLTRLAEPIAPRFLPHQSQCTCIDYSADGRRVVTGSFDRTARVWDAQTGEPLSPPLEHADMLVMVKFTPDGHRLITGDRANQVFQWDWSSGQAERKVHLDTTAAPLSMALSPDGRRVVVGQESANAGVWDILTGKAVGAPIPVGQWQVRVAWSPDGSTLALGRYSNFHVELWDAASMKPLGEPIRVGGAVSGLAFSPDSRRVVVGDWGEKLARVLDARAGTSLGPTMEQGGGVTSANFAPDGKSVAIGAGDGKLRLWDPATGKLLGPAFVHPYAVRDIAFSPDGARLAAAYGELGGGHPAGARIWSLPAAAGGDVTEIRRRVESSTGLRLDGETVRRLQFNEWKETQQATTQPTAASTNPESKFDPRVGSLKLSVDPFALVVPIRVPD